jgi:hypothetical protein
MVNDEEVAEMDGSQPGKMIDPQMIRDHGVDAQALDRAIRDIELDALKQQHRLALARPMARERPKRRWRRIA